MGVCYSDDVANAALAVCKRRFEGDETCALGDETFDLVTPGWCGRFVRQCHVAAGNLAGVDLSSLPWYEGTAYGADDDLVKFAANGQFGIKRVSLDSAVPGCVVAFDYAGPPGHIALYVGEVAGAPTIAENTTASRGQGHPGTGLTPWSEVTHVLALYQVLPPRPSADAVTVLAPDGNPLACNPSLVDKETWVDLGALLPVLAGKPLTFTRDTPDGAARCKLREVVEAFGGTLDTSQWPKVKIGKHA